MRNRSSSSSLGAGLIAWISTFAAGWIVFLTLTQSTGLTLVFSVFVALVAFDLGRRSLRLSFVIIACGLIVVLARGLYLSFA